jgi:hypothetical protein
MKTLIDVAAGIAGGLLGTVVIQQLVKAGRKLPESFQPRYKGDPADVILNKGEQLFHRTLRPTTRKKLKPLLGYGYGMTGPLVLGAIAHRIGRRSIGRVLAAGAIMGVTVWAVGYLGWLPRSGVAEPIQRQPLPATAQGIAGHALYGLIAATPVALAERFVEV